MLAVREEVEDLKLQIKTLEARNNQLEQENKLLRASASPETIAQLTLLNRTQNHWTHDAHSLSTLPTLQVSESADTFVEVVRSEGGRVTSLLCQMMAAAVRNVWNMLPWDVQLSSCRKVLECTQTFRRDGMVQIIFDALCKIIALSVRSTRSNREIRLPNNNCWALKAYCSYPYGVHYRTCLIILIIIFLLLVEEFWYWFQNKWWKAQ